MININSYFDKFFYDLNRDAIYSLNKQDNGPINNVISHLANQCYGVHIYDDKDQIEYLIFYIDHKNELSGLALLLSLELDLNTRTSFTIEFSKLICDKYPHKDIVDVFNSLQSQLRSIFEKMGFFTVGNEIDNIPKGSVGMLPFGSKGMICFPTLDKLSVYRWFFDENTNDIFVDRSKSKKVYLLLDSKNNLIKIGQSINPKLREKTLQGINPEWDLITTWVAPISEEKRLHKLFENKNSRGEWFNLNFNDLKIIKKEMEKHKSL